MSSTLSSSPDSILLLSTYELGHQPLGLAWPLAFLEEAGFRPAVVDLAVQELSDAMIRKTGFVAISVPMHTALRQGIEVARRVRRVHPEAKICFTGHYAVLHAKYLRANLADFILGGELEADLVKLLQSLSDSLLQEPGPAPAATAQGARLAKLRFPLPSRASLPAPKHYAHAVENDRHRIAAAVESTRGCKHSCRHCPIPAVYHGRFFVVPVDVVVEDVRQLVAAGVEHVTFADADFLNGPSHARRLIERLHSEFPELRWDFTTKVEHILQQAKSMPHFRDMGAAFVVTAVEILNDEILGILDKGHTVADVHEALAVLDAAGLPMRPSWMPFTPWTQQQDFVDILDFVESEDLVEHVDPIQYGIRLLIPEGSLLLERSEVQSHVSAWRERSLSYEWRHPRPEMDALQRRVSACIEEGLAASLSTHALFQRIRQLAGSPSPAPRRRRQRPPRLTEPWFC